MSNTINDRIAKLVRPEIKALQSYHVPSSENLLKLDAMENPYSWPGEKYESWVESLKAIDVNRYPDPSASGVKKSLRDLLSLDKLQVETGTKLDILLGNGSDEIIQIMAMALASKGRSILAPEPSFVMYNMIASFVGMSYVGIELKSDYSLDISAFLNAIETEDPALIFLAIPNNPTGNVFEIDSVIKIIEAANGLVVLDEAYMAFTDSDLLGLCAKYDNVVVMRTLSKVGLAGLRLGFLIGQTEWLSEFDKVRLPYNINVLTQASAEFAIENYGDLKVQTDALRVEREALYESLSVIDGVEPYPSQANFILVKVSENARQVFENMKQKGVLIKCLDGAHPLLSNCLRLTVGTADQNQIMISALKESLI